MKVCVVTFSSTPSESLKAFAASLAKGIEAQGFQVDLIDGSREENAKLTIYQYIAVGTEQCSVFGRIDEKIAFRLGAMGMVQGKNSFAFVKKKIFGEQRALLRLMKVMEKEGMFIRYSDVLLSEAYAYEIGKRLHIGK
ncbi:MAG TPA: hypothetical protein ENN69_08730 [Spirochaetia bacterium]|nr:hypothetical protein [Spirochaetia bacterium]